MRVEQVLKDSEQGVLNTAGEFVRKGTIYTMLLNAHLYEEWLLSNKTENLDSLLDDIRVNVQNVARTGLFNFFTINEWLQNPSKEGRIVTAVLYCQSHPEVIDPQIHEQLQKLEAMTSPSTVCQIQKALAAAL